jgi:site-specific DNA-methyltransferase (adenine-specific)
MRTVWDIPNNKKKEELRHGKHPTQKPLRVSKRMLAISAAAGDVCLVPFAGSGTECVAAIESGLHFVAFENDPEFVTIARKRIADAVQNGQEQPSL